MKYGVVSASEIAKYGRMDAQFHLAVQSVSGRVSELEKAHTAAELLAKLEQLETGDLKVLEPLTHGQHSHARRDDLIAAARAYPHIAYALVLATVDDAISRANVQAQDRLAYLQTLQTFRP
jgi:hypothetical protein